MSSQNVKQILSFREIFGLESSVSDPGLPSTAEAHMKYAGDHSKLNIDNLDVFSYHLKNLIFCLHIETARFKTLGDKSELCFLRNTQKCFLITFVVVVMVRVGSQQIERVISSICPDRS